LPFRLSEQAGPLSCNVSGAMERAPGSLTSKCNVSLPVPAQLLAVNTTVCGPLERKAWVGCCALLKEPSPKFHDQEEGVSSVASVNCTTWPRAGDITLADASVLIGCSEPVCVVHSTSKPLAFTDWSAFQRTNSCPPLVLKNAGRLLPLN